MNKEAIITDCSYPGLEVDTPENTNFVATREDTEELIVHLKNIERRLKRQQLDINLINRRLQDKDE